MDTNNTTIEERLEEITYFPFEGGITQLEIPQQPYSLQTYSVAKTE